jgi:small subunit ribosomal protein S17e
LGKVKTEQIKRAAKELMKRYPTKFSSNFDDNKHMVDALTQNVTTRVRNQIAGYITQLLSSTGAEAPTEEESEE